MLGGRSQAFDDFATYTDSDLHFKTNFIDYHLITIKYMWQTNNKALTFMNVRVADRSSKCTFVLNVSS